MGDPYADLSLRETPQDRPADSRQVPNSAGGFTFALDDWARLDRFLILGTAGGTYYTSQTDLTAENFDLLRDLAADDASRYVDTVVAVSAGGRAPRNQPALFALAVASAAADVDGRRYALDQLPLVARTSTHLFTFLNYATNMRGWGRQLRRAVADWYTDRDVGSLAHQMVKYRQREGWTHRDVLRMAHPTADDPQRAALFDWACDRDPEQRPDLVAAYEQVQAADTALALDLIRDHGLPWETLPDRLVNEPAVWEAIIDTGIGQTALIRQLPRLTRLGLLAPLSEHAGRVTDLLTDPSRLTRIHPVAVLDALLTYRQGRSVRGTSTWTPVTAVVDALDAAFYLAFDSVTPAGARTLLAVDVSASMTWGACAGSVVLTPMTAAAAVAMVTDRTEPETLVHAFSRTFVPVPVSGRQRLDDVERAFRELGHGGTDCAQPMLWAAEHGVEVDAFHVLTDNETWAGQIHPHQALVRYRERTGVPARLVVYGMTSTGFTIADPDDGGMLDIVGLDAAAPQLAAEFAGGRL